MEFTTTARGFPIIKFTDRYGEACSLQKSSLAGEDAIWLGIDDANPQVLASQAAAAGVRTNQSTGWVPYPIPKSVSLSTRMHLTQEQVAALLPVLEHFAKTGELPNPHSHGEET